MASMKHQAMVHGIQSASSCKFAILALAKEACSWVCGLNSSHVIAKPAIIMRIDNDLSLTRQSFR